MLRFYTLLISAFPQHVLGEGGKKKQMLDTETAQPYTSSMSLFIFFLH